MRTERGVAAITAILVVAVAASAAAVMLNQQSAMLDQTMMVASRAQADLYAQAGLDWARGVLAQDARQAGEVDSLDEGWARPIAGLAVERAIVSGNIADEQGKLNLNNLVNAGQPSPGDVRALRRLLALVGLSPELADAALDWIDADSDLAGSGGAEDAFYLSLPRPYRAANREMVQIEELYRVRGFDAPSVAKLRPYVTAIRGRTAVNVNTASDMVLAAILGLTREQVAPIVAERGAKPFRNKQEFTARAAKLGAESVPAEVDVKSANFLVRVQVAQDDVHVATESLLTRGQNGVPSMIWRRSLY